MNYVDGYVVPVPEGQVEAYRKIAEQSGKIWKEHGALEYKECVMEDSEDKGFCATFPHAFQAKDGETITFAYVVYKDRAHRDEVNAKVMADPRLHEICDPENMPFEARRMAYGGFNTIVSY